MFKLNNKGLTIVELIVVIAVLGLLFSFVIPKIDKNPYYLLSTSKVLRNDIRSIKYLTMTEGTYIRILFEKYSYKILEGPKQKSLVKMNKGYKIIQNFKENTIVFNYNGTPLTGGGTILILDESTKKYCEITVVPATGRILMKNKIYKGYSGK
jgi:prepilin-type N-terminal cleavage/methylation domain-containing protein